MCCSSLSKTSMIWIVLLCEIKKKQSVKWTVAKFEIQKYRETHKYLPLVTSWLSWANLISVPLCILLSNLRILFSRLSDMLATSQICICICTVAETQSNKYYTLREITLTRWFTLAQVWNRKIQRKHPVRCYPDFWCSTFFFLMWQLGNDTNSMRTNWMTIYNCISMNLENSKWKK